MWDQPGAQTLYHWSTNNYHYSVHLAGAGDNGLDHNATANLIQAAYNTWEAVTTSNMTFTFDGIVNGTEGLDGINGHYWIYPPRTEFNLGQVFYDVPGTPQIEGASAFTVLNSTGFVLTDVDILYNGLKDWRGDSHMTWWNEIQSVAIHEIGHSFGMWHADNWLDPDPVMTLGALPASDRHTLKDDDEYGISFLYGGNILYDRTFAGIDYYLWDITVAAGVTLTIAPNSTINFENGSSLTINGNLVIGDGATLNFEDATRLIVNGTIDLNGTTANPVIFGTSGTWGGIQFNNGSSGTLDYCDISNASYGIRFLSGSSGSISNSTISGNQYGIYISSASPQITNNILQINNSYGIYAYNSSPSIVGNTLTRNGHGIALWTNCNPLMVDNTITSSTYYGLACYGSSSPAAFTGLNTGGYNTIEDNGTDEVIITGSSDPDFGNWKYDGNNEFVDAAGYIINNSTGNTIDAERNWWGSTSGPDHAQLFGSINYARYHTSPLPKIISHPFAEVDTTSKKYFIFKNVDLKKAYEKYYEENYVEAALALKKFLIENPNHSHSKIFCLDLVKILERFLPAKEIVREIEQLIDLNFAHETTAELNLSTASYYERMGDFKKALDIISNLNHKIISKELSNRIRIIEGHLMIAGKLNSENGKQVLEILIANMDKTSYLYEIANLELNEKFEPSQPNYSDYLNFPQMEKDSAHVSLINYPNPFNPTTTINYTLLDDCNVELIIYDIIGRKVNWFIYEVQTTGIHKIVWDGTNRERANVSSGIYFYKLITRALNDGKTFTHSAKMMLVK